VAEARGDGVGGGTDVMPDPAYAVLDPQRADKPEARVRRAHVLAVHLTETGAGRGQPVVQRASPQVTRRLGL
jgi:hypothetical protein